MRTALSFLVVVAAVGCSSQRICVEERATPQLAEAPAGCAPLSQASDGAPSGFAQCADGSDVERFAAVPCTGCVDVLLCTSDRDACASCGASEVCAEGSLGACFCHAPCDDDDDCGSGAACVCPSGGDAQSPQTGNLYPQCIAAACRTNDDCGGGRCRLSADPCGGPERLACTSEDDACVSSADCAQGACRFDVASERFVCAANADC